MAWFDLIGYLLSLGAKHSEGGSGPQLVLPCPRCGDAVLYINVDEGAKKYGNWVCFRCRDQGEGGAGRTVISLVAWIEDLSFSEARTKMIEDAGIDFGTSILDRLSCPDAQASSVETDSVSNGLGDDGLPRNFEPVYLAGRDPEIKMPSYLTSRGVTVAQARKFGLGFCEGGKTRAVRRYSGRIVFPIRCPLGDSFTTRAVDDYDEPRYLAGPRAGSLVYGWPQAKELLAETGDGHLVVVEGCFDVLAVFRAGVPALGVMSKHIGESELEMARRAGATSLTMILDADAISEAVRVVRHGVEMKAVEKLPGGAGDPGEATVEQILEALVAAEPLERVWARWLRGRLVALKAQR